jgi:CheY-like chemotaxis protein
VVKDGDQAVEYLFGTGRYANQGAHPLPDVILLDLTLPGRSGRQVLEWMQTQPALKHIPVVVLTSSIKPADLQTMLNLGVKSYHLKPESAEGLRTILLKIKRDWLDPEAPGQPR